MRYGIVGLGLLAVVTAGCATKSYPTAVQLSPTETELMTCRELALEAAKTESIAEQIRVTRKVDMRSIMGFAGDFGIGNKMAKQDAVRALEARKATIIAAQSRKKCDTEPAPA